MASLRTMVLAVSLGAFVAGAEAPLAETRSTLEKWVEARQLASKSRADWQSDKELLEQSLDLFTREMKAVDDQAARLGTNSVQVDKERAQAEASLKSSNDGLQQARSFAAGIEGKILKLVPRLPAPLQEILKPNLRRLPANPGEARANASDRIQVIAAILNELDKFNNAITLFNERRRNDKGEEVAVDVVYVGLGAAYFVNDSGDFAGVGSPGETGWVWRAQGGIAQAVRDVIRIYRNDEPARFVSLPVTIK